jgi:ABC-2 type transport system ATP-binding protein
MNVAPASAAASAGAEHGAAPAPPPLELSGIGKRWARQPHPLLDGVELTLEPGEAIFVGGRNGAGKTTLLRIAAGLIFADRGSVALHGLHPVRDRREYQRRLGFLSAGNSGLYARLSVRRHLNYWARLAFIPRADCPAAVGRALTRFQLHELADRRTDRMSMGQRQRLRLAGAFLHDPSVVMLDEPRNSLDDEGAAILRAAVRGLTLGGGGVIWCAPGEHDHDESDRRYFLEAGRLMER